MKRVARNLTVQCRNASVPTRGGGEYTAILRNQLGRGRVAWFCLLVATLTVAPGCSVFHLAKRTLKYEPRDYDVMIDEADACKQYAVWAEEAWGSYLDTAPAVSISPAFEQGFREGFVDFVFAGGTGEPPPVPPRRFWRIMYRSPQGDQMINDWSAGFRTGAAAARHGGYRARALVPAFTEHVDADESRPMAPWQLEDEIHNVPNRREAIPAPGSEPVLAPPDPLIEAPVETPPEDSTSKLVPPDKSALPSRNDSYLPSPTEELLREQIDSPSAAPSQSDSATNESTSAADLAPTTVDDQESDTTTPENRTPDASQLVPDQAIPDQAIPEQTIPDRTFDDQSVPDEPLPDDALDDNPFDPLPGIDDPLDLPDQQPDTLPVEELFEDLFGPEDVPKTEAYRRQTIPSDRVIQHTPSRDGKQPLPTVIADGLPQATRPATETAADESLEDVATQTRPLTREDWFIGGLSSSHQATGYKTNSQQTNLPGLLEPTQVDRIADRLVGPPRHAGGNSFTIPRAEPTQSRIPADYPARAAPVVHAPRSPIAKSGGVSSTAADAIAGSAANMVSMASQATYNSPVVDSSDAERASGTDHTDLDQHSAPKLSSSFEHDEIGIEPLAYEPSLSDSFAEEVRPVELDFSLDHLEPNDENMPAGLHAASSELMSTNEEEPVYGFQEISPTPSKQPIKIRLPPQTRDKSESAESLFSALYRRRPGSPTADADKSTRPENATERILKARRAFQGPFPVQTDQQRYSGLFQN